MVSSNPMNCPSSLTAPEFRDRLDGERATITLVGMSNAGKSYWSKVLELAGFTRLCCDDLIEQGVSEELCDLGYRGIADMAKWLGQPYDERYQRNQARYLELEEQVTLGFVERVRDGMGQNTVIDTTGSVVHLGRSVTQSLSEVSTVTYLQVTNEMRAEMYRKFLQVPKPVVWGNNFTVQDSETPEVALGRCYPGLLEHRSRLYAAMADVTIPRPVLLETPNVASFVDHIATALPEAA